MTALKSPGLSYLEELHRRRAAAGLPPAPDVGKRQPDGSWK